MMRNLFWGLGALGCLALMAPPAFAEESQTQPAEEKRDAFTPVEDDPRLPRVLLIGDSISIGYTMAVQDLLAGEANVHRIPENGGPTREGLEKIEQWLGEGEWDVIHFNFGLHDMRRRPEAGQAVSDAPAAVPIEEYQSNLKTLVERLRRTRAELIFATTTPVMEGSDRRLPADVARYNEAAIEVMKELGVRVNDLHETAATKAANHHTDPTNVHYTAEGSRILAQPVAEAIRTVLERQERR